MSRLSEALELLRSEPDIIRHSPFARSIDGSKECAPLVKVRDDLRAQIGNVKSSAPPLDSKRVWQRFEASRGDLKKLNGLEIRTLCTADEFATKPVFAEALQSQPEYLKNGRCLYGMVNSYFMRWREMEKPERLEALLTNAINRYPRKSPVIERWRSAHSLFSARAAEALAEFVVSRQSKLDTVLKLQYVGAATRLAVLTRAKAAELAADRFKEVESSSDEPTNVAYLQWMLADVLTESLLAGALHYAVSTLILSRAADTSEAFQQTLRNYVQSHPGLGDPRLRQCMPNWRDMQPDAQQRFLSWIAKENILFFFNTILPRNDENRRRAEFWLRYHTKITDFQVAISEQDAWKLKANKSQDRLPLHSRVTQGSTSAFLMQFKGYGTDYVIAEFSETGNAAYIYDRAAFESRNVNLRTPQFQLNRHLKHERWPHRILHLGGWEFSARQKLANLGIFP
jgi:hypothetical protein